MAKEVTAQTNKHRSVPIADSKFHVTGYPKKLTPYQTNASPFYWVRYYADGKILRRSTKTESRQEAIEFAKAFYDEINLKRTLHKITKQLEREVRHRAWLEKNLRQSQQVNRSRKRVLVLYTEAAELRLRETKI